MLLSHIRLLARRFPTLTFIAVGVICGLLAVLFHKLVELATALLIGRALAEEGPLRIVLTVVIPTAMFVLLAWAVRRFAPRAIGANLARVRIAYNTNPRLLGARTIGATFIATPLSLGAGAPLGPEGPIVVVSSGVAAWIGRVLRLPEELYRSMIPIGVAAGIAAVFNTPITGVVFALEEVLGSAGKGVLGGVLVGSVSAAVVERMLLGGRPLLAAPFSTWTDPSELLGFALVGLAAGATSGSVIRLSHRLKRGWSNAMPSPIARAALAGLLIGAAGLIAPEILGVGYEAASHWLNGGGTVPGASIAFAVKLIAFTIAISGGIIGGTFAPSLFIGTALGATVGLAGQLLFPAAHIDPKAYAIVGMGAFFAGLLRSPIAAVLIVVELTRDYELIVPLMLAVALAVSVSRRIAHLSIVEQQMLDEGYVEEHGARDPLARVRVAEAMSANVTALGRDLSVSDAAAQIDAARFVYYPIVDAERRLQGIVSRHALADAPAAATIADVLEEPKLIAASDDLLIDVIQQMQIRGVDRCPVVDTHASRRLAGFLSPSDILRVRLRGDR
jgi:CIC family chloride channel protein